jgi:hypothetical protein
MSSKAVEMRRRKFKQFILKYGKVYRMGKGEDEDSSSDSDIAGGMADIETKKQKSRRFKELYKASNNIREAGRTVDSDPSDSNASVGPNTRR